MRRLSRRVVAVGRVIEPAPNQTFHAYARAVVAYGGGDPGSEAADGLACWLERGRRESYGLG